MVSSIPSKVTNDTKEKHPGAYNKAKPSKPVAGKPQTVETTIAIANARAVEIKEYIPEDGSVIPNKVVAISPKKTSSQNIHKIQEMLQRIIPKESQPELEKYINMSDDELMELFSNFLLDHNKLESEPVELKKKYEALKKKVDEDVEKHANMSAELDKNKKTIEEVKKKVALGSNIITHFYNSPCEIEDLKRFVVSIKETLASMKEALNISDSDDEIKDEIEIEEEKNVTEVPSADSSDAINKGTETPSLEINTLEHLLLSMTSQSADALTLKDNLDLQLEKSGDKITEDFLANIRNILKTLDVYAKNMKNIKKELNKLLPELQDEIISNQITYLSEKDLHSFEIIFPGITKADLKIKIENHLQRHEYIEGHLLDLLIRYAQSHMIYITLLQKIKVSKASEKMEKEEIKKIEDINKLLGFLGLDFKAIKIPKIHYKVLNSLFKIIRGEVSSCYEKFRGDRRAYMEINTSNLNQLKQNYEKSKLEFSCIETKWNIIASYLSEMMFTMQRDVKTGEYTDKIPEPVLERYALVRHIPLKEVKDEFVSFEETHSEKETLTIMLNKDYETFWRDVDLVKFELYRLIDAFEVQNGSFLSETAFSTKQKARSWNYFSSLSANEQAIEKMFPKPKLKD